MATLLEMWKLKKIWWFFFGQQNFFWWFKIIVSRSKLSDGALKFEQNFPDPEQKTSKTKSLAYQDAFQSIFSEYNSLTKY